MRKYLRLSRSEQTCSHWVGSPKMWCEGKKAATSAGTLVRCLSNQSRFKMPPHLEGMGEEKSELLRGSLKEEVRLIWSSWARRREIWEKSGKARALMGGCWEWRCLVMDVCSSGYPKRATRLTGGVLSSSGYSSISPGSVWGSDVLNRGRKDLKHCVGL